MPGVDNSHASDIFGEEGRVEAVRWRAYCAEGAPSTGLPDSRICTQPNCTLSCLALLHTCFRPRTLWECLLPLGECWGRGPWAVVGQQWLALLLETVEVAQIRAYG